MVRPKTIKVGSGEVILKNYPIEERNEIINKISPRMDAEFNEDTGEYELVKHKEEVPVVVLDQTAWSFAKVGNMWSAIEVAYNLDTKQAEVRNITPIHTNVNVAQSTFRTKYAKNIL